MDGFTIIVVMPPEIDVSNEMNLLRRRMAEHGFKSTPQRDEIARWVFTTHDHFTVDDIIHNFRERGRKISTATAYRVVQMMLQLNLLLEHDFGRGTRYYEHTPGHAHHDHIICNDCGKIFEFSNDDMEKLKNEISAKMGFAMTRHTLSIYGDCTRCTPEEKEARRKERTLLRG